MTSGQLEQFEPPRETLEWAREAIQELDASVDVFFSNENIEQVVEQDPHTKLKTVKLRARNPLPRAIRRKATEALNNIRHSFDQSTFAACAAAQKPLRKVNFPWADSPTDLKRRLEGKAIPVELWEVFERHEPYRRSNAYTGGNDIIRELATIANGKHTIGLRIGAHVAGARLPNFAGSGSLKIPMPRWDPVKNEMVIAVMGPDMGMDGHYNIAFHVALKETGALRDVALQRALGAFFDKAEKVLQDLEAQCIALAR